MRNRIDTIKVLTDPPEEIKETQPVTDPPKESVPTEVVPTEPDPAQDATSAEPIP